MRERTNGEVFARVADWVWKEVREGGREGGKGWTAEKS
jgi:hypothetical protein